MEVPTTEPKRTPYSFHINMPIKVTCNCGQSFNAKDELAGKKVRCPKCSQALVIPSPDFDDLKLEAPAPNVPKYNPLEDILAEEGVKSVQSGPTCPSCGEPVSPSALICVQCGYNLHTGEQVTASFDEGMDDDELAMEGMSETEKMMYKAEQEIDDMPISAEGEKFGDEGDSYIIAIVMGVIIALGLGIAVFTVIQLDKIEDFDVTGVSFWMSLLFSLAAMVSATITAFFERPLQGYLCLSIVYIPFYAITRGLWIPFGIMTFFGLIAIICGNLGGGEAGA